MTTQTKSLYDRLGGLDAINALTESWVARVGGDDRANGKFARTDIPRLKKEVAGVTGKTPGQRLRGRNPEDRAQVRSNRAIQGRSTVRCVPLAVQQPARQ